MHLPGWADMALPGQPTPAHPGTPPPRPGQHPASRTGRFPPQSDVSPRRQLPIPALGRPTSMLPATVSRQADFSLSRAGRCNRHYHGPASPAKPTSPAGRHRPVRLPEPIRHPQTGIVTGPNKRSRGSRDRYDRSPPGRLHATVRPSRRFHCLAGISALGRSKPQASRLPLHVGPDPRPG